MTSSLSTRLLEQLDVVAKAEGFGEYTIEHEAGSNNGDGFNGTMIAVTIIGKHRDDRLSLICKLKIANETRQENFQADLIFDREVLMYNTILPALESFQREHGLNAGDGLRAYPKCYLATNEQANAVIIMENLRASGHAMWDKRKTMQIENVKLLVEQLALMHGVSVAIRHQRPELFAEWQKLPNIFAEMAKGKAIQGMIISSYDRASGLLADQRHIDIMQAFKNDWLPINVKRMDERVLGAYSVLIHGDCWNNNMMFKTNDDGTQSICIVDWQMSRVSSPAVDLGYFLFSSTEKSLRDRHWDELLRLYYSKFSDIMRRCGTDPDKFYTFDDLLGQLRDHAVFGVLCAPILISVMVAEPDQLVNVDEMVQNENDQEHHLAVLDTRTEAMFKQRISDVMVDAIEYGWLSDYVN